MQATSNIECGNYVERLIVLPKGGRIFERCLANGDQMYIPDAQRLPTEAEAICFYAKQIEAAELQGWNVRIRPDRRPNGHKRVGILFVNVDLNLDTELANT